MYVHISWVHERERAPAGLHQRARFSRRPQRGHATREQRCRATYVTEVMIATLLRAELRCNKQERGEPMSLDADHLDLHISGR
jgi:hypothetical protein